VRQRSNGRPLGRGWLVVIGLLAVLPPTLAGAAPAANRPINVATARPAVRVPPARGAWTPQTVLRKPFSPTSPWNTPISPGARFRATATFAGDPGWMTSEKNSNPIYLAKPTDPILTFNVVRPNITRVFQVRGPADLTPAVSKDLNLTIVDIGTNHVWDFFRVTRTGPTTFRAEAFGDADLDGTGFGYFPAGGGARVRAGVKASGASWLGGIVTAENLTSGGIDHALAIHVGNDDLYPAFVPPAVEFDNDGSTTYRGTLPMGTRLGIPPGTPQPPGLSPIGLMLFDALSIYGGYVVDRNAGFNLVADARTVPESVLAPVRQHWRPGGSDLSKIVPLLHIVG
jgi:hypothetical protein